MTRFMMGVVLGSLFTGGMVWSQDWYYQQQYLDQQERALQNQQQQNQILRDLQRNEAMRPYLPNPC